MPLSGPNHRQHERQNVADQADLPRGPLAKVHDDPGHRGSIGGVHIRQPCEAERSESAYGAEDRGSLEDGPGPLSIIGGADLHEGRSIDTEIPSFLPHTPPRVGGRPSRSERVYSCECAQDTAVSTG